MKKQMTLAAALILALTAPLKAPAQQDHGHGAEEPPGDAPEAGATPGRVAADQTDMMRMMQRMMRMHAGMMGGSMDMGGAERPGISMMDSQMMRMMMGPETTASRSAEDAVLAMRARLAEYDADASGSLSLAEFEILHAAMIRETTVDRFQHLDADGDGQVTEAEMAAPARRLGMQHASGGAGAMMKGIPNAGDN